MGVEVLHPEYLANEPIWSQLRAQDQGERGVKSKLKGRDLKCLPAVSQAQIDSGEYEKYKARAEYVDFLGRTISGLVGTVMQKAPEVSGVPDEYLNNIDNRGTPLDLFVKETLREVLLVGRCGLLVERPASEGGRSYLVRYQTEQITNWEETTVDSETRDLAIVLHESRLVRDPADRFTLLAQDSYRVLDLIDGRYEQTIYEKADAGRASGYEPTLNLVPRRNGAPLDRIPFVFVGPSSMGQAVQCPPILALANVNLHHYRLSADLRDALFKLSKPKMFLFTQKDGVKEVVIDDKALQLDPGDNAIYLEYAGTGLTQLRDEMTADEARMVILGARLLEGQKRAAETAEALRLRQSGESATLHDVVETLTLAVTRALRIQAEWDRFANPDEVSFELNRDFAGTEPTPEEITSRLDLVSDRNGATLEDHHQWLYRQGLTTERDFEAWLEIKSTETPAAPASPFGGNPFAPAADDDGQA